MKNSYTLGPWEVDYRVSDAGPAISGKDGFIFCQIYGDKTKSEANAQLIASAPDLLEALRVLLESDAIKELGTRTDIEQALKAIAKAEGES